MRGKEGQGGRETETEGNRETERARARTCIMVKPPTAMFSTMPAIWPWVRGVTLRLVPVGDDLNAVRMRLASLRNLLKGLAPSTTCRAPARQGAHASSAHSVRRVACGRRKASAAAPRPRQHERVDTRAADSQPASQRCYVISASSRRRTGPPGQHTCSRAILAGGGGAPRPSPRSRTS